MGVCNCSMFCCTLLCVRSSIAIILMGKRELVALLNLSSWCLVMVERLILAVPQGCLQFVIVVFPDHTHLLFKIIKGIEDIPSERFFKLCTSSLTRGHSLKLEKSRCRTTLQLQQFSQRFINSWSSLPEVAVLVKDVNELKSK